MFSMLNIAPRPKPKPVKVIKTKGCKGKRKPKTPRQLLEIKADTLVREIVLKRDVFCVCPAPEKGHSKTLQCGHLITRGRESIKWDLWNCSCQCSSCNMRHSTYNGWHYYDDWFIREFGKEERLRITRDSYSIQKLTLEQLQILCNELTSIKARQEIDKDFRPRYTQSEILAGTWRKENATQEQRLQRESPLQQV